MNIAILRTYQPDGAITSADGGAIHCTKVLVNTFVQSTHGRRRRTTRLSNVGQYHRAIEAAAKVC
jgi:hypothetical protein